MLYQPTLEDVVYDDEGKLLRLEDYDFATDFMNSLGRSLIYWSVKETLEEGGWIEIFKYGIAFNDRGHYLMIDTGKRDLRLENEQERILNAES